MQILQILQHTNSACQPNPIRRRATRAVNVNEGERYQGWAVLETLETLENDRFPRKGSNALPCVLN